MRTSYEVVADPDVPRPLLHLVTDLDSKHVDGHNRLRVEAEAKEKRLAEIERIVTEHGEQLKASAKRTTDIQQLRFTPAMFAATVALCASLIAGGYASTSGLRERGDATNASIAALAASVDGQIKKLGADVDGFTKDILGRLQAQADLARAESKARDERDAASAKLADERAANQAKALAAMDVKMNMQDVKMNNLRETVLTGTGRK